MLLFMSEIILTIIAWRRNWKALALLPLGIGLFFMLCTMLLIMADGVPWENIPHPWHLDVLIIIVLAWMIISPKEEVEEENYYISETKLDLTTLNTVMDLESIKWSDYFGSTHNDSVNGWVKHIKYPVAQRDLDRVCKMSKRSDKIRLNWNAGELFVHQIS